MASSWDGDGREEVQELLGKPFRSLGLHDPDPRKVSGHEREGDVTADGKQQGLPWHGHVIDAEEPAAQQPVKKQHCQGAHRHHDQGVTLIAFGKVAPDQHHGGAGGNAEEDGPGDVGAIEFHRAAVLEDFRAGQQVFEKASGEQSGDGQHGEEFDAPVDDEGKQHRPGMAPGFGDFAKIDLHHDRIHHEEEANGDGDGNHRGSIDENRHDIQRLRQAGREFAKGNPGDNAQTDPEGQLALKKTHGFGFSFQ